MQGTCVAYVVSRDTFDVFARCGDDLLSHVLRRSTISAVALNGRVRDGIGCFAHAMITTPKQASSGFVARNIRFRLLFCVCVPIEPVLSLDRIKPIGPLVPVN